MGGCKCTGGMHICLFSFRLICSYQTSYYGCQGKLILHPQPGLGRFLGRMCWQPSSQCSSTWRVCASLPGTASSGPPGKGYTRPGCFQTDLSSLGAGSAFSSGQEQVRGQGPCSCGAIKPRWWCGVGGRDQGACRLRQHMERLQLGIPEPFCNVSAEARGPHCLRC